jgi:hypothetical protein
MSRLLSFGVNQLFGGARRGQPVVAAFGAAVSAIVLLRRWGKREKLIYSHELREGETFRVRMWRGEATVDENG